MASWSAPRLRQYVAVAIGVLGLFLTVDALLAYAFVLFAVVIGSPLNPYLGIVLVVVLPLCLGLGLGMIGWAWSRLEVPLEVPEVVSEVALQGR